MTQSNNLDVNKLLSEELETKIYNVNQKYAKTRNEIKAEILDIYNSAIAEGYTAMQARRICEERIDIFSDRTIRRWLPSEATRSYSPRPIGHLSNSKEDKQPATLPLPPRPEPVKEVEIIPVREPPKAIDEPITIPTGDKQIMLDTGKFRSDLRIALINGAKVWLSYNNAKEVIKINEKANPQV